MVNESSVFEPLKFSCNLNIIEIKYVYTKPKGLDVTPEMCNDRRCGIPSIIKSYEDARFNHHAIGAMYYREGSAALVFL